MPEIYISRRIDDDRFTKALCSAVGKTGLLANHITVFSSKEYSVDKSNLDAEDLESIAARIRASHNDGMIAQIEDFKIFGQRADSATIAATLKPNDAIMGEHDFFFEQLISNRSSSNRNVYIPHISIAKASLSELKEIKNKTEHLIDRDVQLGALYANITDK
jgi:hypothetical protein